MPKCAAIILFIPLLLLFLGNLEMSAVCTPRPVEAVRTAKTVCPRCPQGKSKTPTRGCTDCPLCTPVTFNPIFRLVAHRVVSVITYAVIFDDKLPRYAHTPWKPPEVRSNPKT